MGKKLGDISPAHPTYYDQAPPYESKSTPGVPIPANLAAIAQIVNGAVDRAINWAGGNALNVRVPAYREPSCHATMIMATNPLGGVVLGPASGYRPIALFTSLTGYVIVNRIGTNLSNPALFDAINGVLWRFVQNNAVVVGFDGFGVQLGPPPQEFKFVLAPGTTFQVQANNVGAFNPVVNVFATIVGWSVPSEGMPGSPSSWLTEPC